MIAEHAVKVGESINNNLKRNEMEHITKELKNKIEAIVETEIRTPQQDENGRIYFSIVLSPNGKRHFNQTFKPVEIYDVSTWGNETIVAMLIKETDIK